MNLGALINEKNVEGQTPLHLLADSQLRFRSDYIRNKKVDKMALNNQNLTALDIISSTEDLFGRKAGIVRHMKRAKARVGPLLRQKTMSESKRKKGLDVSFLKKASDSHMLVATLVATVSFAAGFTLPGGYNNSDGTPMLRKKLAFRAFVIFDFVALMSSVTAILSHFYGALNHKKAQLASSLRLAYWFTKLIHCGTAWNSPLRMPKQDYVGKYV
ncbi:protein ACCELERATED CELL DEATH 6-like [Vitis riparia]|uniref:protein ACCELERATED CELL DEATH 6-like n=1 Tax=Vitis riparia TaxID=96939 RepID=UPI00155A9CC7|nr:protein ACCELERATED CELL DEATH 6-like [Vitis riparia]